MRVLLLALALLLALPVASAHVPSLSPESRSIDGARSWAFYDELAPGDTHRWTFELREGERLFLLIAVPRGATWTPEATLAGPTGDLSLVREDRLGYEPATPYSARDVWSYDGPAPASGLYEVAVSGEGGRYAFGYGLNEVFTPVEWATIPVAAVRIHQWEGQPLALILAPHALTLAAFVALARARPLATRMLVGLYAGSAASVATQAALAIAAGARPDAFGVVFTSAVILASALLAWGAWRARRAWALALLVVGGLVAWSGLLVGPALAAALAVRKTAGTLTDRAGPRPAAPRR